HDLLGLGEADDAGKQVTSTAVRDDAAPHEHLDESRVLSHDDEVARQHEARAATGSRSVHCRDHRLLAVEDRCNKALPAAADDAGNIAERTFRRVIRALGSRLLRTTQARARAEVTAAGSGQ